MKKLLNTLYITKQSSYLHKELDTIVIKHGSELLARFPALTIGNIFCFGQISVSPFLMGYCSDRGIGISFCTEYGKFLARVQGRQTGNVLLRRTQFRWADDDTQSLLVARLMVAAKIANCRSVLMRELRNYGDNLTLKNAIIKLALSLRNVKTAKTTEEARGIEGDAARCYFGVFNELIRVSPFQFEKRVRRPPTDPVNALLSFMYSILTQECSSALQCVGLDPYVGFLHKDRPGRASLALDLVEEFRCYLVDRFILTLINRRQIQLTDFVQEGSGACRMTDTARKSVLAAWQRRKQTEINHPYLNESLPLGLLPHSQAILLARHIRGDTKFYTPFLVR